MSTYLQYDERLILLVFDVLRLFSAYHQGIERKMTRTTVLEVFSNNLKGSAFCNKFQEKY